MTLVDELIETPVLGDAPRRTRRPPLRLAFNGSLSAEEMGMLIGNIIDDYPVKCESPRP